MILLLLLLVVLAAAAVAGLLGLGILSGDRWGGRSGLLALLSAPVVVIAGLLAFAVLFFGVRGFQAEEEAPSSAAPATTTTTAAAGRSLPLARVERPSADLPVVSMRPVDDNVFAPYEPVSGLAPGAVVRVQAEGWEWHERGRIAQCVVELGRETACAEAFPVQFDGDGKADFQVAVRADVAPGGCRTGQPACLLRLTGDDTGRRADVQTVLVDRLTPAQVRVEPARALRDGQTVEISVTGFPAGTTATAVLCAPPDTYDARRCAPPGSGSTFAVDATGSGRTSLVVGAGRLGPDQVLCGPRRVCGVSVVAGSGFVAAPVAPLAFAAGPGVAYEAGRVVPGVVIAAVLVGVALLIARRTDWTKPSQAATPEMDASDLRTDQDLDDLFGTDEELDARDPVPW